MQNVACPAAHVALGTVVPPAAGAVEQRVLDLQLLAVGGLAGVVDTAGWEARNGTFIQCVPQVGACLTGKLTTRQAAGTRSAR